MYLKSHQIHENMVNEYKWHTMMNLDCCRFQASSQWCSPPDPSMKPGGAREAWGKVEASAGGKGLWMLIKAIPNTTKPWGFNRDLTSRTWRTMEDTIYHSMKLVGGFIRSCFPCDTNKIVYIGRLFGIILRLVLFMCCWQLLEDLVHYHPTTCWWSKIHWEQWEKI